MSKFTNTVMSETFTMIVTIVIASMPVTAIVTVVKFGVVGLQLSMFICAVVTSAAWWWTTVVNRRLSILNTVALLTNDKFVNVNSQRPFPLVTSWVLVSMTFIGFDSIAVICLFAVVLITNIFACTAVGADFASTVTVYRRAFGLEDGDVYAH